MEFIKSWHAIQPDKSIYQRVRWWNNDDSRIYEALAVDFAYMEFRLADSQK